MVEMIIMLHDVQRTLALGIGGSLSEEYSEEIWSLTLEGLFDEPMSELCKMGMFTSTDINVSDLLNLCNILVFTGAMYNLLYGYYEIDTADWQDTD